MSDERQPTAAEIAALERELEYRQQVAALVSAGQILDQHRAHLVGQFLKGLAIGATVAVAFLLMLLLQSRLRTSTCGPRPTSRLAPTWR